MKKLLSFAAAAEAATGLLLMAFPWLVAELLSGHELVGNGIAVGRIAGISLISLAVACWPRGADVRAFLGLLLYNASVAVYLTGLGLHGEFNGRLLWPAAGFHIIVTILLAWLRGKEARNPPSVGAAGSSNKIVGKD